MFSILKKKKEEPKDELEKNVVEASEIYSPFPELSGKEKFEAVEQRLIQKFREGLIEGKELTVGDVCKDLEWIYDVMNPGETKHKSSQAKITSQRIATYHILRKTPELWAKIEEVAAKYLEEDRFDFQAQYIMVCNAKARLPLFKSIILQDFPEFCYFTVLEGAGKDRKIKRVAENYETYEELEVRLLQEGYKFVREDAGSKIYWKDGRKDTV